MQKKDDLFQLFQVAANKVMIVNDRYWSRQKKKIYETFNFEWNEILDFF